MRRDGNASTVLGKSNEIRAGLSMVNESGSGAGPESFIAPKMFDGLLAYDFGLAPRGQLATAWEMSEDGTRITFHLREGVKWHDGTPFTAHDVAFTFLQVLKVIHGRGKTTYACLLYTSPSPRDRTRSRMPSSA